MLYKGFRRRETIGLIKIQSEFKKIPPCVSIQAFFYSFVANFNVVSMADNRIENLNIQAEEPLITPQKLKQLYPLTNEVVSSVENGQSTIKNILNKRDHRIFAIVGPCSIHDTVAAKEYADKLKKLADEVKETVFLVMRVYFEKPRTNVGWQGLINDPYLDGSCKIEDGLKLARALLLYAGQIGLPVATEALDQVTPQYVQDLISWTAIGARTTESQNHRKMASGFTSAVGFKNGTKGNVDIAIHAMASASSNHNFISVNPEGRVSVIRTKGNPNTHIILRGGKEPNYDEKSVKMCEEKLLQSGFIPGIVIDCSHGNSSKNPFNQPKILESVTEQIVNGNTSIRGVMLESNLNAGNQKIPADLNDLKYGVSITDACIDWETTETCIKEMHHKLKGCIEKRRAFQPV